MSVQQNTHSRPRSREAERTNLAALVQAGDRDLLLREMEPWVQREARIFRGRTGTRLSQEDAAQEVRLAVFQCAQNFDPDRGVDFLTYAGRRVRGALLNAATLDTYDPLARSKTERQKRYQEKGEDLHFVGLQDHYRTVDDPVDHLVEVMEDRAQAEAMLDRLEAQSPRYAQVVRLTFGLDGNPPMDAREMGEVLGVSKETAQKLRQRALKALGRLAGET